MTRKRSLSALSVLSILLILAATVMVFAQDRIFDADDFATTLGSTLRDPASISCWPEPKTAKLNAGCSQVCWLSTS